MDKLSAHWTERDLDDYMYRIASDFALHVQKQLLGTTQKEFARNLRLSEGRISQVLNKPGNMTLKQIIKFARALGQKVAIVAYDDNDPKNLNGPIPAEVFTACWERASKPEDFFALSSEFRFVIRPEQGVRYTEGDASPGNESRRLAVPFTVKDATTPPKLTGVIGELDG